MSTETCNYYEILEVSQSSSQDSIYKAYQLAKKTYCLSNPNIFSTFSKEEALAWNSIIEEAYSVIGHPNTRRVYDQELQSLGGNLSADEPELEKRQILKEKELPQGFAATLISEYEVNKNMEDLIEKQELFDGLFLKKIREYKKIDLADFSQHTCIAIRHLYAIENNNFSVLPAPVFVRGYIIQYCRVLNLDQKRVVDSFMPLLTNG